MANGHGGYRRPTSPAPVSGPGALSKRTDGKQPRMQLPDPKYGEQQAFQQAQAAAPMSQTNMSTPPPFQGVDTSGLTPMAAPTQRPNEPISAGMSGGPGGGPFTAQQPSQLDDATRQRLASYLPVLTVLASQPDVSPATKQFIVNLRAELG